jgi:hypothetical protein
MEALLEMIRMTEMITEFTTTDLQNQNVWKRPEEQHGTASLQSTIVCDETVHASHSFRSIS